MAVAIAGFVAGGCVHRTRLQASWFQTPETPSTPVTILLANRGLEEVMVSRVTLNHPQGRRLWDGVCPTTLAPGEALQLPAPRSEHAGKPAAHRLCIPMRLFVSTHIGQKRPRRVEIDRPMPSAFVPEALDICQ